MLIYWRDLNITFSRQISCHLISLEHENYKQTLSLGGGFKHFSFSPLLGEMIPNLTTCAYFSNGLVQLNHQLRSLQNHVFFVVSKPPKSFSVAPGLRMARRFRDQRVPLGNLIELRMGFWSFFLFEFDPCKNSFLGMKKTTIASETMDIYIYR